MSLTIQHNPSTYHSVHGDLIFTVVDIVKASDPVSYPDYKYVADVYIGAELVAREKAVPHPDTKIGIFNLSNIIRNYVANSFSPTANAIRAQQLGLGEFNIVSTVKFGEEFGFTLYTNVTVDSARTYYNHYNGRMVGDLTLLDNYLDKPITVRPLTTPVRDDSRFNFIPYLPTDTDNVTVTVKAYTLAGALLNTYTTNIVPSAANTQQLYNASVAAINTASPGFIVGGLTGYYTVQFVNPNITDEPIYRFDMKCEAKYEVFTLHFMNKFGGMESRDFTKVSRKTIDIERSEFGKLGYTMDVSGVISYSNANKVYNETRQAYSRQYKEKMILNTDILTDEEYTWLGDLILSTMVYVEVLSGSDSYFLPCAIVENNYDFRKAVNDKLTNLTLNIEFGEQFNSQYR